MLKLEEYIAKRKSEDGMNEFDKELRIKNNRIAINYVLEYFENYIDLSESDEQTIVKTKKTEKYRKALRAHSPDVIDWLVNLNIVYGCWLDRVIVHQINDPYFFLYTEDEEFNTMAYKIYYKLIDKYKYLNGAQEKIKDFLIGHQRKEAGFPKWFRNIRITDEIDLWIQETYKKFGINLYKCFSEYVDSYLSEPNRWPVSCKIKSKYYEKFKDIAPSSSLCWEYDISKSDDIFELNSFYRDMPKKPFIKGKKHYIEILFYYLADDGQEQWTDYKNKYLDIQ